jgi:hypothetical protein
MKKAFHKIASFCLALITVLSTVSFTVDSHYCGDVLVDSSLFGKVETCGMEVQKTSSSTDCDITKKNCCSDKQLIVEGQDTLKTSFDKLEKEQQIFVAVFFHTYNKLFEDSEEVIPSLNNYPPPIIVRHIYKLDETYLI